MQNTFMYEILAKSKTSNAWSPLGYAINEEMAKAFIAGVKKTYDPSIESEKHDYVVDSQFYKKAEFQIRKVLMDTTTKLNDEYKFAHDTKGSGSILVTH